MSALSNGNVISFKDYKAGLTPLELREAKAMLAMTPAEREADLVKFRESQAALHGEAQTARQEMWDELKIEAVKLANERIRQAFTEGAIAKPAPDDSWLDDAPKDKPAPALSQHIGEILAHPTTVRWLKRDEIERGVIAVISGPRGSCKTAAVRRWALHVAVNLNEPVLIFNGEGTGIDRQINGEIKRHYPHIDPASLPIYVVNKRMDLNGEKGRQAANAELTRIQTETGKRPALVIIDTFSKFHFGLQEKDNAAVSLFISGIDAAVRRPFDCTVAIVTHTGYADQTRARGASALEADTDSAYVVSKDPAGIVRVSRERFKDSPELPPLTFKPEVIDLGYRDADDVPVTTISLVPTTECPKYQAMAQQPNGKNQIAAFGAIKELSPLCDPVDLDDATEAALARREIEPTHETRRDMRKAIKALALKRLVWVDGEQCGQGMKPGAAGEFENVAK
jgi:hypothetical protein